MALTQVASGLIASVSASTLTGTQTIPKGTLPTGSVLQVVSASKTDTFSTSSTSYVDVTGLSLSITPSSSSSKILIMYQFNGGVDTAVQGILMQLARNTTAIFIGDAAGSRPQITAEIATGGAYSIVAYGGSYLDSPATTSATTYKIQIRTNGGVAAYVNRSVNDRNTADFDPRASSSITVMEIAA